MAMLDSGARPLTLPRKLLRLNWPLVVLLALCSGVGFAMLYSVADGDLSPWAGAQMKRFAVGMVVLLVVALIDVRLWYRVAWALYGVSLVLLVGVEVMGTTGMGAQRWLMVGPIRLQPSELMKVALVVVLARYYHDLRPDRTHGLLRLFVPLVLIALPCVLVLKQPDLGTAMLLGLGGLMVMFLGGASLWFFGLTAAAGIGTVWAVLASKGTDWQILKDYQYRRIDTFLDPTVDPQGAGYQITQSKIAFGSGGAGGMGWLQGPQSRLDFLPEKHTDFIFTVLGEEFGLRGSWALLALYLAVILLGLLSALRIRHAFGRLVASGVSFTFFCYFAINMAMIMGLAPVVGVPLPLVSYGGTSMIVLLFAFGLLLSAQVHGQVPMPRRNEP